MSSREHDGRLVGPLVRSLSLIALNDRVTSVNDEHVDWSLLPRLSDLLNLDDIVELKSHLVHQRVDVGK